MRSYGNRTGLLARRPHRPHVAGPGVDDRKLSYSTRFLGDQMLRGFPLSTRSARVRRRVVAFAARRTCGPVTVRGLTQKLTHEGGGTT